MRSSVTAVKDLDTRLRFDVRDDEAQAIFVCNPKVAQLEESVAVANARRRSNRTIPGSEFLSRYVVGADVAIISEDLDGVAIAVRNREVSIVGSTQPELPNLYELEAEVDADRVTAGRPRP